GGAGRERGGELHHAGDHRADAQPEPVRAASARIRPGAAAVLPGGRVRHPDHRHHRLCLADRHVVPPRRDPSTRLAGAASRDQRTAGHGGRCRRRAGGIGGRIFSPAATLLRFGRWTPDFASQHILSPLVNGFLAVTTTYLLVDLIFRRQVVPRVFPEGRLTEVPGTLALGVRGRLLVFLVAAPFSPLFTALGLVRAAGARLAAGLPAAS